MLHYVIIYDYCTIMTVAWFLAKNPSFALFWGRQKVLESWMTGIKKGGKSYPSIALDNI